MDGHQLFDITLVAIDPEPPKIAAPKKKRNPPAAAVKSIYGTSRLLKRARLEEFAQWAVERGYSREGVRGEYEVLRLRWPGTQPIMFHRSSHDESHVTCPGPGTELVILWLRSQKPKRGNAERNHAIYLAKRAGHTFREVAAKFNITHQRVQQIYARVAASERRDQASEIQRLLARKELKK